MAIREGEVLGDDPWGEPGWRPVGGVVTDSDGTGPGKDRRRERRRKCV